jgi:two-component system, sensor histidine kinase
MPFIDVTARRQVEQTLRATEHQQRLALERLSLAQRFAQAGTWEWDRSADQALWSKEYYALHGHDPATVPASYQTWLRSVHPADRVDAERAFQDWLARGEPDFALEYRIVHPNKGLRWVADRGHILYDAAGQPRRVIGLVFDITERKRIEAEALQAQAAAEQANQAKSKFLAAVSHDLRQPVQALVFLNRLLAARLTGHPAEEMVNRHQAALDALTSLLDSLADISKLDAGMITPEIQEVSVMLLLERLHATYAPRFAAQRLKLKVVGCAVWVRSDPSLLARILGNLVDNALKYTEAGGVVIGCRRRSDRLHIRVIDTGLGIPPERLNDIFEEFTQLANPERDRTKGLGLGLSIVQRLAQLLGHDVQVHSVPGRGSSFTVVVPLGAIQAVPGSSFFCVHPLGLSDWG